MNPVKKKPEPVRNPIATAPVHPPRDQPDDAFLHVAVTALLELDGRLAGETIDVAVQDGIVELTGTVSEEFLRQLADAHASAVPGVLVVKNQLSVTRSGPNAEPPE